MKIKLTVELERSARAALMGNGKTKCEMAREIAGMLLADDVAYDAFCEELERHEAHPVAKNLLQYLCCGEVLQRDISTTLSREIDFLVDCKISKAKTTSYEVVMETTFMLDITKVWYNVAERLELNQEGSSLCEVSAC